MNMKKMNSEISIGNKLSYRNTVSYKRERKTVEEWMNKDPELFLQIIRERKITLGAPVYRKLMQLINQ